jgi:hypothetical protein
MNNLEQIEVKKPKTLEEKLVELEAKTKKIKNEIKAKQQAELRAKNKAEEKKIIALFSKHKSYFNDLELVEGTLLNLVKALQTNDEGKINYFRRLVQENS